MTFDFFFGIIIALAINVIVTVCLSHKHTQTQPRLQLPEDKTEITVGYSKTIANQAMNSASNLVNAINAYEKTKESVCTDPSRENFLLLVKTKNRAFCMAKETIECLHRTSLLLEEAYNDLEEYEAEESSRDSLEKAHFSPGTLSEPEITPGSSPIVKARTSSRMTVGEILEGLVEN